MTKNLTQRLKRQGYSISDCSDFEYYDDEDIAADREKQLNLRDGYGWNDSQDYRVIKKAGNNAYKNTKRVWNGRRFTKEEAQLGGYITGKYPTEKAREARRNNTNKLNQQQTCPHCGKIGSGLGYNRWHGNNCRSKNNQF